MSASFQILCSSLFVVYPTIWFCTAWNTGNFYTGLSHKEVKYRKCSVREQIKEMGVCIGGIIVIRVGRVQVFSGRLYPVLVTWYSSSRICTSRFVMSYLRIRNLGCKAVWFREDLTFRKKCWFHRRNLKVAQSRNGPFTPPLTGLARSSTLKFETFSEPQIVTIRNSHFINFQ
jgi:hypothetical protein